MIGESVERSWADDIMSTLHDVAACYEAWVSYSLVQIKHDVYNWLAYDALCEHLWTRKWRSHIFSVKGSIWQHSMFNFFDCYIGKTCAAKAQETRCGEGFEQVSAEFTKSFIGTEEAAKQVSAQSETQQRSQEICKESREKRQKRSAWLAWVCILESTD